MKEEMEKIPETNIEISQPIQMRFNELMTEEAVVTLQLKFW
jgi:cobalt-zinc-cadmium resistance protein CzcA